MGDYSLPPFPGKQPKYTKIAWVPSLNPRKLAVLDPPYPPMLKCLLSVPLTPSQEPDHTTQSSPKSKIDKMMTRLKVVFI